MALNISFQDMLRYTPPTYPTYPIYIWSLGSSALWYSSAPFLSRNFCPFPFAFFFSPSFIQLMLLLLMLWVALQNERLTEAIYIEEEYVDM